jgi:UrcA family protein
MQTKILFTTLVLTTALAFAGSAQAAPAPTPPSAPGLMSVRVSVADLDLRRTAGADVALRRIHRAAVVICGDEPQSSGLARYALYRGCVKTTVRDALASRSTQFARDAEGGPSDLQTVLAASR